VFVLCFLPIDSLEIFVNNKDNVLPKLCFFLPFCHALLHNQSVWKLKFLFSNVIIFIYDSPFCDKVSACARTVDCCFASGWVICISAHLLSKSFSFYLFSSSLPVFSLSLYHSAFVILKDVVAFCECFCAYIYIYIYIYTYLCVWRNMCHILCWCNGSVWMCWHCLYERTDVHYRSNFLFCLQALTAFGTDLLKFLFIFLWCGQSKIS